VRRQICRSVLHLCAPNGCTTYAFAEAYGAKWAEVKRQFQERRERHDGLVERRMQVLNSRHSGRIPGARKTVALGQRP
jgi:transposase